MSSKGDYKTFKKTIDNILNQAKQYVDLQKKFKPNSLSIDFSLSIVSTRRTKHSRQMKETKQPSTNTSKKTPKNLKTMPATALSI